MCQTGGWIEQQAGTVKGVFLSGRQGQVREVGFPKRPQYTLCLTVGNLCSYRHPAGHCEMLGVVVCRLTDSQSACMQVDSECWLLQPGCPPAQPRSFPPSLAQDRAGRVERSLASGALRRVNATDTPITLATSSLTTLQDAHMTHT